jgi:5S rRNA maturation endonuclease (ribonuclease M5)
MINLNDPKYNIKNVTLFDNIYKYINDYDIFKYYLKDIPLSYNIISPLRYDDTQGSFRLYQSEKHKNKIFYRDFGTGESGDGIKFVKELYHITKYEAIIKIICDFGLHEEFNIITPDIIHDKINSENIDFLSSKEKFVLSGVNRREWKGYDIKFWKQYGIDLKTLNKFDVNPIERIFFDSNLNNNFAVTADKYAYVFVEYKDNINTIKTYQPYGNPKVKWFTNHDPSIHQGYTKLPKTGDIMIITKSLKDVMSLDCVADIPSIGIQNENIIIKESVINEYKDRFKKVYTLFDNDKAGLKLSDKYKTTFGITGIIIPDEFESKDYSDLVKNTDIFKAKEIIYKLIEYYERKI